MKLYTVTADAETGIWLDDLELIGEVDRVEFANMSDTNDDDYHYDTFENANGETCAVIVHWADEF